jgi:hypothetical protein
MNRTKSPIQPRVPDFQNSEDYDELLLLLQFGHNSSSSFTSKTTAVYKGSTKPGSLQALFDGLSICQDCNQNHHGKDQVIDNTSAESQPDRLPAFTLSTTLSEDLPTFTNFTRRDEDPQVAMFQDYFQIPTASPNTLQF